MTFETKNETAWNKHKQSTKIFTTKNLSTLEWADVSNCTLVSGLALWGAILRVTVQGPHLRCASVSLWGAFPATYLSARSWEWQGCTQNQSTLSSHRKGVHGGEPPFPGQWGTGDLRDLYLCVWMSVCVCVCVCVFVCDRKRERESEGH